MGRSIHTVEGLISPILRVDERLTGIPRDSDLYVLSQFQSYKLLFFLKADHVLFVEGHPTMEIKTGDILVQPLKITQMYKRGKNSSSDRLHLLRLIFDLPLLEPAKTAGKKAKRILSEKTEADLRLFVLHYFDRIYHLPKGMNPHIHELIASLRKEVEAKKTGYRLRISSICMELIVETARKLHPLHRQSPGTQASKSALAVQSAKEFILEQYAKPLTLEEIAWHVRLSREHMARIFREMTGQTVFQYLNSLRIEKAKTQLCNTELLVHEIARHNGFESSTLFGRTFKRLTGLTPLAYRKRSMGEFRFSSSVLRVNQLRK